jgi:exodeoxyribonuclease V alpha subunit
VPQSPPPSDRPEEGPPDALQGVVERVTYHDEESLYTVLRVLPESGFSPPGGTGSLFAPSRVTAVGRMLEPLEGQRVRLEGTWGRHSTHGDQFEFASNLPLDPGDEEGLVRYLSSKAFDGIGETIAQRIVEKLGTGTLGIIRDHPESLEAITGLRASVRKDLVAAVQARQAQHQTAAFLMGLGLGPIRTQTIMAKLGRNCESQVRDDPYVLITVRGMAFKSTDKVARELGLEEDDPRRLVAGIEQSLKQAADNGHSLLRQGDLMEAARELLGGAATIEGLRSALLDLIRQDRAWLDRSMLPDEDENHPLHPVYLPYLGASERGLAKNLGRLLKLGKVEALATEAQLRALEESTGIELHEDQRAAVLGLLASPVALLTGGPGVGKTTIVRWIADLASNAGYEVRLASPTGRAAKRLSEATGRPASTIHRLLKVQPPDGFEHNAQNPLKGGIVLVDEISMLDVVLAHHLISAVASPTRLIMVGDPDQLPAVGAGNVLADLLESGVIPTHRLTQVYRQDEQSLIVSNAHRVLEGKMPEFPTGGDRKGSFYFFPADGPTLTADRLIEVVSKRIPENFGLDWTQDVQVIAPMYKGDAGVDALNDRLRDAAGYGGREIERGGRIWRVGDRVIQTRNDYEKNVFNGDMGRITEVSADGVVTVKFSDQTQTYIKGEINDLRPAFAITVHRSQGGEFPCVVMPLVRGHRVMLQRNLLYTAITRAEQLVVLVGSETALRWAVETADQAQRMSMLTERLVDICEGTTTKD